MAVQTTTAPVSAPPQRRILRYLPTQRLVHWLGVTSVLTLLLTGVALIWRPAAILAYSGVSPYLHRAAAILFLALPVLYAVLNWKAFTELLREVVSYNRDDVRWLMKFPSYFLGHTQDLPPQGRLNAGQKLHHLGTFLAFVAVAVSGLVLWFAKGSLGPTGLALAAIVHDLSMLAITVLLVGHIYFTFVYEALPAMRTGYVSEEYARMEHRKWLEEMVADARRPTTDDRVLTTDDGRPTTDDRRWTTDDRRPTTDDGRLTTDDGRPTTEKELIINHES